MESLRGVINSYLYREEMEVSFLQMLNGTTNPYQEEVDIEQEDNQRLQEQILQHLQQEYNLCTHLKMQECYNNSMRSTSTVNQQVDTCIAQKDTNTVDLGPTKARKKRKRPRVPQPTTAKNPEEMESQRMNHIAVERNRRKLVNSHLNALRSIMPSSFVQRNDQATIVAGAIDFIKELEQHLQSLKAKKRHRANNEENMISSTTSSSCTSNEEASHMAAMTATDFFISPQYISYTENNCGVDVEATVVQGHVNLKIVGKRNSGQMVRAISALEQIGLMVMHLNVTSLDACSILYSLNLKIEEESKMRSADEIASVVHQIFSYIISTCCD